MEQVTLSFVLNFYLILHQRYSTVRRIQKLEVKNRLSSLWLFEAKIP
jgi:hypothetical protein